MPPMLRRNYARELQAFALLPLMLGAIQAGTMSVVLKKTFTDVPGLSESTLDLLVAALDHIHDGHCAVPQLAQ